MKFLLMADTCVSFPQHGSGTWPWRDTCVKFWELVCANRTCWLHVEHISELIMSLLVRNGVSGGAVLVGLPNISIQHGSVKPGSNLTKSPATQNLVCKVSFGNWKVGNVSGSINSQFMSSHNRRIVVATPSLFWCAAAVMFPSWWRVH